MNQSEMFRSWNQPVVPSRIIGNVYYVGASDVTSFLITTPAGLWYAPAVEWVSRDLNEKPPAPR